MVLDDLGLVPTLRRAPPSAAAASGLPIRSSRWAPTDGCRQDARERPVPRHRRRGAGLLVGRRAGRRERSPGLDGIRRERDGPWPSTRGPLDPRATPSGARVAAAQRDKHVPAALASMIHEQETSDARGISNEVWATLAERAEAARHRGLAFGRRLADRSADGDSPLTRRQSRSLGTGRVTVRANSPDRT